MAPIVAYPVVKYLAYAGWCGLLAKTYNPERMLWRTAWGLGVVRLLIGLVLGAFLTFWGLHLAFGSNYVLYWVAVMVPVRWLEWSVTAGIISKSFSPAGLLVGQNGKLRAWQAGGILVSFATDVLMVMAGGAMRYVIC
jgi:hypothetical protein